MTLDEKVYCPTGEAHAATLAADNAEELESAYDKWSTDFDDWHARLNEGFNIPAKELVTFLLSEVPHEALKGKALLDVGAGSGAQAAYLKDALGDDCPKMTALEPSAQMLEQARKKALYESEIKDVVPSQHLKPLAGHFQVVMCCGSIIPSHMQGEDPFRDMLLAAEDGGYLVFNIRSTVVEQNLAGFQAAMDTITQEGAWIKRAQEERQYLPNEGITAMYYCFQKAS